MEKELFVRAEEVARELGITMRRSAPASRKSRSMKSSCKWAIEMI